MTLDALLSALGPQVVRAGSAANPSYLSDWTGRGPVVPLAVLRPRTTQEVARALAICNAEGLPVVPQGGRTGLSGGAQPIAGGVVINLDRMDAAPEIDVSARTARVQAGVTLERLQQAAETRGLSFPVDIGARGSCQIGGMVSTNAGGMRVFRNGMMRANVLGLEVVLPDGRILSAMNGFLKNNTGYDLKQMFIGAEGTLGVVTGAMLRLQPHLPARVTALLRVADLDHALRAQAELETRLPWLAVCEIMWPDYYNFASGFRGIDPLPGGGGPTLLIEVEGAEEMALRNAVQAALEHLFEAELVLDGAIAQSRGQADDFWALREANEQLFQAFASVVSFDLSLRHDGVDEMITEVNRELAVLSPRLRCLWFGHLGDMNLHLGVVDASGAEIPAELCEKVKDIVLSAAIAMEGSISAEHGIGAAWVDYVPRIRSEEEQALSRALRASFDPRQIMNPGRLF